MSLKLELPELDQKANLEIMRERTGKLQTLKQCEHQQIEKALYKWFYFQREHSANISVKVMKVEWN